MQGRKLTNAPFEAQARQVLADLVVALGGAGNSIVHLMQVRDYLAENEHSFKPITVGDECVFHTLSARKRHPIPSKGKSAF